MQNAVASLTDLELGLRLVVEKHSRSTYHNSVRHSRDHSERLLRGTSKEAPHSKPRYMRRRAFSRCVVIMTSCGRSGPAAVAMDNVSARFPRPFCRYS